MHLFALSVVLYPLLQAQHALGQSRETGFVPPRVLPGPVGTSFAPLPTRYDPAINLEASENTVKSLINRLEAAASSGNEQGLVYDLVAQVLINESIQSDIRDEVTLNAVFKGVPFGSGTELVKGAAVAADQNAEKARYTLMQIWYNASDPVLCRMLIAELKRLTYLGDIGFASVVAASELGQ